MTTPSLNLEDQVLLCIASPNLNGERKRRLVHLASAGPDWSLVLEQAEHHGMVPLFYHHITAIPDAGIPEPVLTALAQRARDYLVWNLRLRSELLRLIGKFNEAAIPVIPLKGPWLADLLYPDPDLRSTSDLDLLVRPEDTARAEELILNAGYRRLLPAGQEDDMYHRSFIGNGDARANLVVELHHDLADSHLTRLAIADVWASASRTTWRGHEIGTMALTDLFLYLCLHAVKDGLGSLRSLLDIRLVVERFGGGIPWNRLAETVRAARLRTPVYLSLLLSHNLMEAPVPLSFVSHIRPARGLRWYLGQAVFKLRGSVLHASPALMAGPIMALLLCLWEDSLRGRVRHLRRNLWPSASLRARRMAMEPSASVCRWYLAWLFQACAELGGQLSALARVAQAGPHQH
jgi:hypothetical protein